MKTGILQIHTAVFLFGFSGLFGKFLSCSPWLIVFGRTFFAFIAIFVYAKLISKISLTISDGTAGIFFILQGILLGIHWWSFFLSIQLSSVAVGLITFSSFPLFVTFLEPVFLKEKILIKDLLSAAFVFTGVVLVVPDYDFSNHMTKGAFWGVISGLTFALLSIANKANTKKSQPVTIAFYQNLFAALFLIFPIIISDLQPPSSKQIFLLIILGVFCTGLAHTLFIKSLVFIKAQTAAVITGLEPVYGIILACLILGETPSIKTVSGGLVIIGTTVITSIAKIPGARS